MRILCRAAARCLWLQNCCLQLPLNPLLEFQRSIQACLSASYGASLILLSFLQLTPRPSLLVLRSSQLSGQFSTTLRA
jgi:hypothetical protein